MRWYGRSWGRCWIGGKRRSGAAANDQHDAFGRVDCWSSGREMASLAWWYAHRHPSAKCPPPCTADAPLCVHGALLLTPYGPWSLRLTRSCACGCASATPSLLVSVPSSRIPGVLTLGERLVLRRGTVARQPVRRPSLALTRLLAGHSGPIRFPCVCHPPRQITSSQTGPHAFQMKYAELCAIQAEVKEGKNPADIAAKHPQSGLNNYRRTATQKRGRSGAHCPSCLWCQCAV